MCDGYHPILCIIPPHMLESLAENGTPAQREMALRNLAAAASVRGEREAAAQFAALAGTVSATRKERLVYDGQNSSILPGRLVRAEDDPASEDVAVNEAFDGAGATYDLFKEVYGRNSMDDRGMRIISTVHHRRGYDNAFWNGSQMAYGDGDEDLPESQRVLRLL